MDKYEKIWKGAMYFGVMQIKKELIDFMQFLDDRIKINNFLEIGVYQGASFYAWATLSTERGIKTGIDYANAGLFGHALPRTAVEIAAIKQKLEIYKPNTHLFFGKSQSPASYDFVVDILGEEKLDFLFIDADHTYDGVKNDFEKYSPLVRKGGIVALHDIKDNPYHRECRCDVNRYWQELQGEKYEFLYTDTEIQHKDFGGIGAIIKE